MSPNNSFKEILKKALSDLSNDLEKDGNPVASKQFRDAAQQIGTEVPPKQNEAKGDASGPNTPPKHPDVKDLHRLIAHEMMKCADERSEAEDDLAKQKDELESRLSRLQEQAEPLEAMIKSVAKTGEMTPEIGKAGLDWLEIMKQVEPIATALRMIENNGKPLGHRAHGRDSFEGDLPGGGDDDLD